MDDLPSPSKCTARHLVGIDIGAWSPASGLIFHRTSRHVIWKVGGVASIAKKGA